MVASTHGALVNNQIGNSAIINGLLWDGWKFDFGDSAHFLYYAFVNDNGHSWTDAAINGPNAAAAYETALSLWGSVAQLQFIPTTDAANADFNEHLVNQTNIPGSDANHQEPDTDHYAHPFGGN